MPDQLHPMVVWLVGAGAAAGALWQIGRVMTTVAAWIEGLVRGVVRDEIAPIKDQLRPNGGDSLRDQVDDLTTWARKHDPEHWSPR